ncbi:MAG: hypothetical protein AB7V42_01185 [Thermoleophilia bacterium]
MGILPRIPLAAALLGAAAGVAAAGPPPGQPPPATMPSCATVPVAVDGAAAGPFALALPAGGTCREVAQPDGTAVVELYRADGTLAARASMAWCSGATFYGPDGVPIGYVTPGCAMWLPPARLAAPGRQRAVLNATDRAGVGVACRPGLVRVSVAPGRRVVLRLDPGVAPARLWMVDARGRSTRLPARRTVAWTVPRSAPPLGTVALRVVGRDGGSGYHPFCLRVRT